MPNSDAPRWFTIIVCSVLLLATGCEDAGPRVQQVDVPEDVFTFNDEVLAYLMQGEEGNTYEQRISVEALRSKVDRFDRAGLLEYTSDSLVEIRHARRGDTIIAQLRGGSTYLVVAEPIGGLRAAYKFFCWRDRYQPELIAVDPAIPDRLCPLVLCPAAPFRMEDLYQRVTGLDRLEGAIDLGSGELPFFGGQQSICEKCGRLQHPSIRLASCELVQPEPVSSCEGDLFKADFEDDAIGNPPATAPPGPPPGDALAWVPPGAVTVIGSSPMGSNAVRIDRATGGTPTEFRAIPDTGPHTSGIYEVTYRAYIPDFPQYPPTILIRVRSPNGDHAFQLGMKDGQYGLVTGDVQEVLPITWQYEVPDEVIARLDLDAGTVSVSINGTNVASGHGFKDAGFAELGDLHVEHVPADIAGHAAALVMDDIKMCKLQ